MLKAVSDLSPFHCASPSVSQLSACSPPLLSISISPTVCVWPFLSWQILDPFFDFSCKSVLLLSWSLLGVKSWCHGGHLSAAAFRLVLGIFGREFSIWEELELFFPLLSSFLAMFILRGVLGMEAILYLTTF